MRIKSPISILLTILLFIGCIKEKGQIQAPIIQIDIRSLTFSPSLKGWELYSWPVGTNWKFSILIGTNRTKTYHEVTNNEVQVTGIDSLKMILEKFPENEVISWFGSDWLKQTWNEDPKDITLPPEQITKSVKLFCDQKKLQLQIVI